MKRLAVALLAGAVALSACSKTSQTGGEGGRANSWTIPHTLRYANAEDINTLNTLLNQQVTLSYLSSMTAAFLIKWNAQNLPYPELATEVPTKANGGISQDGLTITYHLRKGLKWSDGAPLDADDVVFTYHEVMNAANNITSRTGWDLITKIDEPDKSTAIFHLKKPYAPFIVTFFSMPAGTRRSCQNICSRNIQTSTTCRSMRCRWAPGRSCIRNGSARKKS